MRKPIRIIVGVVLTLLLLLLLIPTQPQPSPPQAQVPPLPLPKNQPRASPMAHEDRSAALQVPFESPIQAAMLWSNTYPGQAVRYAAVVSSVNAPIHFFGLCVDQDGKPLPGVSLKLGVRHWKGISPIDLRGEGRKFERTSDATGRFELSGTTGDVAGVDEASKPGYVWIRSGTVSIDFSVAGNRIPNPAKPVVLQFWKKLPAEPMFAAGSAIRARIPSDGNPSAFDLKSGLPTKQPGNEAVVFQLHRDPAVLNAATTSRPSWKLTVTVPNGGVQLALTNMPFVAPIEAYAGLAEFGFDAGDTGWAPRTNATLYFRTGSGMYGRLEFDVAATTDGPVGTLKWNSVLNPSGSPVLEYDPAKTIKVPPVLLPTVPYQQRFTPPAPPAIPGPAKPGFPAPPQPPPGFQAFTNRGKALPPPVQPRQP